MALELMTPLPAHFLNECISSAVPPVKKDKNFNIRTGQRSLSEESLPDKGSRFGIKNGFESHESFCVLAIKSLCILIQTPDLQNLTSVESHVMACNSLALFAHASDSRILPRNY